MKLGQVSATGSFQLFLGKTLSTVILAVGTIVLGMLISEGDYGLYAIALVPATTMLLFQDWGRLCIDKILCKLQSLKQGRRIA